MTTRILIVNFGDHSVDVDGLRPNMIEGRDGKLKHVTYPLGALPPKSNADFYVYDTQAILITERKE